MVMLEEDMLGHSWFVCGLPCEEFEDDSSAPRFCRSHYAPSDEALQRRIEADEFDLRISQDHNRRSY